MVFEFDADFATENGLQSAIFIAKMSAQSGYIFSHSLQELSVLFPFWSESTIKRVMKKARNDGLIRPTFDQYSGSKKVQSYRVTSGITLVHPKNRCSDRVPFSTISSLTVEKLHSFTCNGVCMESTVQYENVLNGRKITQAESSVIFSRSEKEQDRPTLGLTQLDYRPVQDLYPTVIKLYMNSYNIIIIIKEKRKRKKKEKNFQEIEVNNFQRKIPASSEHFFNSKLVLAELNNLLLNANLRVSAFPASSSNLGPIINQLKSGYTVEQCLYVVKNKFLEWYDVPKMQRALNPKTLFSEKFENYVGEKQMEKENEKDKRSTRSSNDRSTASQRAAENLGGFSDALDRAREKYGNRG